MNKSSFLLFIVLFLVANEAISQDLIYKPINPAFGGDTFNYQWLLSSAQAQNKLDQSASKQSTNPLDNFEDNLNRLVLNELSRKLANQIFGEEGLQEGTYKVGPYQVSVLSGIDGIKIGITGADGNSTEIKVPYY